MNDPLDLLVASSWMIVMILLFCSDLLIDTDRPHVPPIHQESQPKVKENVDELYNPHPQGQAPQRRC
jgi:hypothetical protein